MWFIYYKNGTAITNYLWWTWFSALLAIYISWAPVVLGYILQFTGLNIFINFFFNASLISLTGPMVGYFVPMIILILAKTESKTTETGLYYASETQFWLGWFIGIMSTLFFIVVEFAFLPGIRVWRDIKLGDPLATIDDQPVDDGIDLDEGPITFG